MYRPPSLVDVEPRTAAGAAAFARAGSLGYLVVDADVDPHDFDERTAGSLANRVLREAAAGGVILLHDGGGDRSATVAALPLIIDGLRHKGLEIVPLGRLIGRARDEVMPGAARTEPQRTVDRAVFGSIRPLAVLGRAVLVSGLLLAALRVLLVVLLALRRRRRPEPAVAGALPSVTALIPVFNERSGIAATVRSVLESDIPVDVLVIDDGSTDGTGEVVRARFAGDPRVRLLTQANGGKAAALRTGFTIARSEIVVALDGDTWFRRDTVRRLLEPLVNKDVAAVAGTAEVRNLENRLTACQRLEYLVQQELERRAWGALGKVPVVPGAVGAWRRRAVLEVGGFSSATLAEDADLAMALCRSGWRVVHAPAARALTEVPASLADLRSQRRRWSFGVLQALWKHRRALIERRAGSFGRVVWPCMLVYQVLVPVLGAVSLASLATALMAGTPGAAALVWLALLVLESVQVIASWLLCDKPARPPITAAATSFIWTRLYFRPLLYLVALRSLWRVLDGVPLGWGHLGRRGPMQATAPSAKGIEPGLPQEALFTTGVTHPSTPSPGPGRQRSPTSKAWASDRLARSSSHLRRPHDREAP
jgi:cellulose synthase/poly-beta-1,6-N-acetylglucosamine synthase-like glycosyltransferase